MARRTITASTSNAAAAAVVTFLTSHSLAELLNSLSRAGVRFTSVTKVQGESYSAVAVRLYGSDESRGGIAQVALSAQLELERNSVWCSYFMGDVAAERVAMSDSHDDSEAEAAHEAACEKAAAEYMENRSHSWDSEDEEGFDGGFEEIDAERRAEQLAAERLSGDWY